MTAASDFSDCIGATRTADDEVTAGPINRLYATLDREEPPVGDGDAVPPLAHWLFFLPADRQSGLGLDGHAARGEFLPSAPEFPRRMWAGSRITFHAPMRVGMKLRRNSRIVSVKRKEGASGPLLFTTLRHEIAERDGEVLVTDEHDIVYRSASGSAVRPAEAIAEPGTWRRSLVPDETLLFRYSALTFNGHRIHYDKDYVTKVEGYPGLVVHGPLIATLMMDLALRQMPDAAIASYSFRARAPLFVGNLLHINGLPPDADKKIQLWTTNDSGGLAMTAEAVLAGGER